MQTDENGITVMMGGKHFDREALLTEPALDVPGIGSGSGGLKLLTKTQVALTHARAEAILNLTEFSPDRPLRNQHVAYLVNAMRRGTFRQELVSIITCVWNGNEYRMNGQHTNWARLEMPAEWPCQVTLMRYEAETEHDMRRLYGSIDRNAPRTTSNVIVSYLYDTPEFEGFGKSALQLISQGMGQWLWGMHRTKHHDADDRAYLLIKEYRPIAVAINGLIGTRADGIEHLYRAPVVAAMFATMNRAVRIASEQFWPVVGGGIGVTGLSDPRHRLRNLLMTERVARGVRGAGKKGGVTAEDMYRSCIAAWNAFREGRDLQVLRKSFSGDRPVVHK